MDAHPISMTDRPAVKLAAFACILGVTLGGGALIGAAIGPEPIDTEPPAHGHGASATSVPAGASDASAPEGRDGLPEGLSVSRDGYTLGLETATFRAGQEIALGFRITGPDGDPVTEFEVAHDKELHLIVVSRDLVDYLHVHPERDGDGTWRITLPPRAAGSYRVFADFTPAGRGPLTLGTDIAVAGDFVPHELPAASDSVDVDGYTVSLEGTLTAGTSSTVTLGVAHGSGPVDDLDPYLGALGHLVAIRTGDLAYLHVHPTEEATQPGGPDIVFALDVPTPGTYRLFLDFSHRGDVHTAAFTVDAERAHGGGADDGAATSQTTGDDHGSH